MKKRTPLQAIGQYVYNNLIWLDQGLNTWTGGDPDETVSSRLGRLKEAHGGKIPWTRPWAKIIQAALAHIQGDHCRLSIERDEGKNELFL
jgi:hypothetical protein